MPGLIAAMGAALPGCSTNSGTGARPAPIASTSADEAGIGRAENPKVIAAFGGVYNDPALAAYVTNAGKRVAAYAGRPEVHFTFTVLDSPIVNAMAIPGGYVYVTRGLVALCDNEAELAGVLGHEIGHIAARHHARRQVRQRRTGVGVGPLPGIVGRQIARTGTIGALGFLRPSSREQEFEADKLGARYMAEAGYQPAAMAAFLTKLRDYTFLETQLAGRPIQSSDRFDYLATHPNTTERVQRALAEAQTFETKNPLVGHTAWLERINGILWGESPEQGYVRGRVFIHPMLRIRFEAPPGFQLFDTVAQVFAIGPSHALIIFDASAAPYQGSMPEYIRT
ncbi:MAG: M48 family metalloprotease, partial [Candidatus Binataceae bacterium]